jgi:transposase
VINLETKLEIQRLFSVEKWNINAIAEHLNLHHSTVSRYLEHVETKRVVQVRPKMSDPFLPFIKDSLERYPKITTARLYRMVRARGYPGQVRHFQEVIKKLRPKRHEAFLKLETIAGEQAQVDWAHFGHIEFEGHRRQLMAFVMVLSYSRAIFLHFFIGAKLHCFLEGHAKAFEWFQGVPKCCLYDNLKSVVIERIGSTVRFNRTFLEFSAGYRVKPHPVGVRRGNEKGRVERAIRYIRSDFFVARNFTSLADLNAQALKWCETVSLERRWPDNKSKTVGEMLQQERPVLLALPEHLPRAEEPLYVSVGKTPYVRVDTNDYSVPPEFCLSNLTVQLSSNLVRVFNGDTLVAQHERSWSKHKTINAHEHILVTKQQKSRGQESSELQSLKSACSSTEAVLQMLAERGEPMGAATSRFFTLLHKYGPSALEAAMKRGLERQNCFPRSIASDLERSTTNNNNLTRRIVTNNQTIDELYLVPHKLHLYDELLKDGCDE